MDASENPRILVNAAGGADQNLPPAVAPTPARRPLSVKITNRQQIERLTPAQKQKLMRIVIAKRQVAAQMDDKENGEEGEEGLEAMRKPFPLEKRDSNQFPLPANVGSKRQRTSHELPSNNRLEEHPTLQYAPKGRIPPSVAVLEQMQANVELTVRENRSRFKLKKPEVHIKLVFHDGSKLQKVMKKMTQLFDEVPKLLVNRRLAQELTTKGAHSTGGADVAGLDEVRLVKHTRQFLSQVYATHSRKLMADFKTQHDISAFEINGIDPSSLPLGIDVFWNLGLSYKRIGVVDLRAFRASKSLDESLFFATSSGQAWDVMFALRPREVLHLNWRNVGDRFHTKMLQAQLVKTNELVYVPLDTEADDVAGFDYGAMKSLWSSTVSDDEKRGILRCMTFHFKQ